MNGRSIAKVAGFGSSDGIYVSIRLPSMNTPYNKEVVVSNVIRSIEIVLPTLLRTTNSKYIEQLLKCYDIKKSVLIDLQS